LSYYIEPSEVEIAALFIEVASSNIDDRRGQDP
jgi:hypothetical protein